MEDKIVTKNGRPAAIITDRPGARWSPEAREAALAAYAACGDVREAAMLTRIPEDTIRTWLGRPEASDVVSRVKRDLSRGRSLRAGRIFDIAVKELKSRIETGEQRISRDGEVIRVEVGARDLSVIAGVMAEKAKLWAEASNDYHDPGTFSPTDEVEELRQLEFAIKVKRERLQNALKAKRDALEQPVEGTDPEPE